MALTCHGSLPLGCSSFRYMSNSVGKRGTTGSATVRAGLALAMLITAAAAISAGRSVSRTSDFGAAAAASLQSIPTDVKAALLTNDVLTADQPTDAAQLAEVASGLPGPTSIDSGVVTAEPGAASETVATAAQPTPTAAPVRAAPIATAVPNSGTSCPTTWFCYPRLGLAGPIVPYADCSGSTDLGSSIRSYACLSDHYLMGHAYTSFGLIRQWRAGDVVLAYGTRYTLSGAIIQSACSAPAFPLAPLSLQTSLTSRACGEVLVVQAR